MIVSPSYWSVPPSAELDHSTGNFRRGPWRLCCCPALSSEIGFTLLTSQVVRGFSVAHSCFRYCSLITARSLFKFQVSSGLAPPPVVMAPFRERNIGTYRWQRSPESFEIRLFDILRFSLYRLPSQNQGTRLNHKPQNTEHANSEGGSSNEVSRQALARSLAVSCSSSSKVFGSMATP